jgi:CCR4-NOT transcription complex subunit 3
LEQYFAAKELKKKDWIYYEKFNTWFRRCEDPKVVEQEYETGNYIYFDFEKSWMIRRKTDFTIRYHSLENVI